MVESFLKLELWLRAVVILTPAIVGTAFIIAIIIKMLKSEKVKFNFFNKAEVNLEDIENKVDTAIENQKEIMEEIKK